MKRWWPLVALAAAQFLMVLDQSVMNVSISQLVEDFDTSVTTIQAVITLYCLVMAMFMLTGGKIGDIIGRRRAFVIGLIIYGCGSGLTAAAPTVEILALGWSILEGLGAALVLPALAALIAGNYEGSERKVAYAVIGGVAGAGIAIGPILGGWATTELSWRVVFVGEVAVVIFILAMTARVHDAPRSGAKPHLDGVGTALSAVGSRALRPRRPPVDHLGLGRAQGLPHRAVRLLLDLVRDRGGCRAAVGVRALATPPRGDRERSAGAPRSVADPTAALRAHRHVLAEPHPDGGVLRPSPVPAAGPRARRARDRHQDAAHLDRDVRHLGDRVAPVRPVRGANDRPGRPADHPRRDRRPARPRSSRSWTTPRSPSRWRCSASGWGSSCRSSATWCSRRSTLRAAGRPGGLQYTGQQLGSSLGVALIGAIVLTGLASAFVSNVAGRRAHRRRGRRAAQRRHRGLRHRLRRLRPGRGRGAGGRPRRRHQPRRIVDDYEQAQLQALKAGLLVAGFLALVVPRVHRGPAPRARQAPDGTTPASDAVVT